MGLMFKKRVKISVRVKLFGGLGESSQLMDGNPMEGMSLELAEGTRLKKVMIMLGIVKEPFQLIFVNGDRADMRKKLKDGDIISCCRLVAGG